MSGRDDAPRTGRPTPDAHPPESSAERSAERRRRAGEDAGAGLPPAVRHAFRLIAFDWDGTAVANRRVDASPVRAAIERLLVAGVDVAVITGTNFGNVDRQLSAAIRGPHKRRLYVLTNRGSEVWGFDDESRPVAIHRRTASPDENHRLDAVADAVRAAIVAHTGLDIRVIYDRLNRRKIDLIPLPKWQNPPKSAIAELYQAVQSRLQGAGLQRGLAAAFRLTEREAHRCGLKDARITSDVKHIEVGLTDKSDSIDWLMRDFAAPRGIPLADVLIGGDEFGPIAGFEGSDARMVTPSARGATFVSVGPEPAGVPPGVLHLRGGPARFLELLHAQAALHEPMADGGGAPQNRAGTPEGAGAPAGDGAPEAAGAPEGAADTPAGAGRRITLPATPTREDTWHLVEDGFNAAREHEIESLFAIGNGYVGSRASLAEGGPLSEPATFIAGVYDVPAHSDAVPRMVVAPDWMRLGATVNDGPLSLEQGEIIEHRRILDLGQGLLWRLWRQRDPDGRITCVHGLRMASLADRRALFQSVIFTPENFAGRMRLETSIEMPTAPTPPMHGAALVLVPPSHSPPAAGSATPATLTLRTEHSGITVAFATGSEIHPRGSATDRKTETSEDGLTELRDIEIEMDRVYRLDRFVSLDTSRDTDRPVEAAADHLRRLVERGAGPLIADHVAAWRERWHAADVEISGDDQAQRALRFACYHLISAADPEDDRVSIGARALTGPAYSGHVFWDTDIYMLPFFVYTHPPTARALLLYRYHTLGAAREKARDHGCRGAFFAWESAARGEEATPRRVLAPDGTVMVIRNGEMETHISADIAYAVWQYWTATGDHAFFLDAGAEILLETARFWASRGRLEDDGRFHIRHVIGPDEYHEDVDDDAFTNGMAAWNLEHGVEAARLLGERWPDRWHALGSRLSIDQAELDDWSRFAQAMYQSLDPETGIIEQFQGYHSLESIDLAKYEPRTAPMDVILGHERVQRSQIVKQPDVLMLIYLLWDRFRPDVRRANFRYYDPRTGHGSSLSPCMHALLAARFGEVELAARYFRQSAEIDLADNMGNAAGGVHIGSLGGLWQAAVFGFAGMRIAAKGPRFEPHLPPAWRELRFPVRWRDTTLRVVVDAAGATVHPDDNAEPPE